MPQKNKIILDSASEKERIEKYIKFVTFFNKFINHKKKIRRHFVEKEMKL